MGTNANDLWYQVTIFETQSKAGCWRTCAGLIRTCHLIIDHQGHIFQINDNDNSEKRTWTNGWGHCKWLLHSTVRRWYLVYMRPIIWWKFVAMVVLKRELYGFNTEYNSLHNFFAEFLTYLRFTPSRANQNL